MVIWWGFVLVPPAVFVYAISEGTVDPLGMAVAFAIWLAATVGLIWFLRLPRRPPSN
jgi:hypothetical protein